MSRARLVGLNHVALEVGDVEEALEFYGRIFELRAPRPLRPHGLRGHGRPVRRARAGEDAAARRAPPLRARRRRQGGSAPALQEAGVEVAPSGRLDFRDPWGNHVEVVDYREIQFTKAENVLRGMGLDGLEKSEKALEELRSKGYGQIERRLT